MIVLVALVLVPALSALGALTHRAAAWRTGWLVAGAALHLFLVAWVWWTPPPPVFDGWLAADAVGRIVLAVVSVLFAAVAVYTIGYLRIEDPRGGRAFVSCLLAFLAACSLVCVSQHLALMWVGMEATTLSVAPLIYHRHDRRSLEAVWKYLMLSSLGIALALLGTFFLAAAQAGDPHSRALVLGDLLRSGPKLSPLWLRAAFVFLLAGYGTKMGLAPLHPWKPDTYGEAPSVIAGLMSGALTTTACVGVVRAIQVALAAGLAAFVRPLLLISGMLSVAVAVVFLLQQRDPKRLLAYSSVEHMGLLVLGLGLGGAGPYGALLHAVNNGLAKGWLFLALGNALVLAPGTRPSDLRGILGRTRISGLLLLVGLFAVTGSPPFGLFVSEFTIVTAALHQGHWVIAVTVVGLLMLAFVGMARLLLPLVYEGGGAEPVVRRVEPATMLAGPLVLAVLVLALGVIIPGPLEAALREAAGTLGGSP